ncbi:MAG TPA: DUF58 domain-containing protein [Bryobacterales bacterium]|nr:DUF58 domain-containing protein [Bryobacterales bacterium]
MKAPSPLIDRQMLEKLERLALRWQRSFTGVFGGHNASHFPGAGQEFLDHRQFHQGDDLRSVNWRAYMRLERLFLKMFQIEPRVPVRIFLDASESMACGAEGASPGEPKFAYACRLAAMLCYIGLVRLDTIVLQPFSSTLAQDYPAQGGRHRFAPAMQFLAGLETGGRSDFHAVARQFISTHSSRGLTVILSDFLDEGGCETPIQHLADFGHELLLVHVAGPADRMPPWRGELELVDAESGETRRIDLDARAAERHAEAYDEFCRSLQHLALRNRGRYVPLSTETPVEDAVFGPLVASSGIGLK